MSDLPYPLVFAVPEPQTQQHMLFNLTGSVFQYEPRKATWEDCGIGPIQLLKDISTGQVHFCSRDEKTNKINGNHIVTSEMTLSPNRAYADRAWRWFAESDNGDEQGAPKAKMLTVLFDSADAAQNFKNAFEIAQRINREIELRTRPASSPWLVEALGEKIGTPSAYAAAAPAESYGGPASGILKFPEPDVAGKEY